MRLFLIAVVLFSVGTIVSATYSNKVVENYQAYANLVSQGYATGDTGDGSGWRDCQEMENTEREVGLICEGVRSIEIHGGNMVDVNYYCEFRFSKKGSFKFQIETEACQ